MNGKERRIQILKELETASEPVSGTILAKRMHVSRQVIVQDMALLRATDKNIISTTRGYLLYKEDTSKAKRVFVVCHDIDHICEELYAVVDCGGRMLDISVYHSVYGVINADLIIQNRREADEFIEKMERMDSEPLLTLTKGSHIHTIEADNEEILDHIEQVLRAKGFLVEENDD